MENIYLKILFTLLLTFFFPLVLLFFSIALCTVVVGEIHKKIKRTSCGRKINDFMSQSHNFGKIFNINVFL